MNTIEDLRSGHFKNSYGVEGMLITGDPNQKRIIDVSDEMKELVFENVKMAYYKYNGMSGDNQAEEEAYHGKRNEYYKTLDRDDRVAAAWTLSKFEQKLSREVSGAIKEKLPGWSAGQEVPKDILDEIFADEKITSLMTEDIKEVLNGSALQVNEKQQPREDQLLIGQENIDGVKEENDQEEDSEKRSGRVAFNQGKRARQLASAKNASQVQMVIGLLKKDLSDCENGVANNMCDENEVAKVKAMLQKAMERLSEVANVSEEEQKGGDSFLINMLM
ncbi:DUF3879 family protein [Sporofaciens musculi]|uniref:DUF3879 family protein n=1 Tax=Sporofaciens musculi TaxID=2681861 RepID=UPI002587D6D2|nr:DUF3879 family protein [Sporofaciens musculi]